MTVGARLSARLAGPGETAGTAHRHHASAIHGTIRPDLPEDGMTVAGPRRSKERP
jgi:hypothetical protein